MDMSFEEYLRAMRQRAGITQKDLAEKAKISTSYLNLIETGKKKPNPTVIRRLSTALDGNEDQWLDLAGYEVPELPSSSKVESEKEQSTAGIRIIGEVGTGESPYFGDNGPLEDLDVRVVRVLDNAYVAFGYQQGDLLLIENRKPSPGDLVVMKAGGGRLVVKVYEKSMYEERMIGQVAGFIRRFEHGPQQSRKLAPVEEEKPTNEQRIDKVEKALGDIKTLLKELTLGKSGDNGE